MPRDTNGAYTLPAGSTVNAGDTILVSQHNTPLGDIATALTNSLSRDGQGAMRANLDMGGYRVVNRGAGYCCATQSSPEGGSGTQVEIAYANLTLVEESVVKLTATMTCGPVDAGADWNTHFEIDLDGELLGLRGFDASPLEASFTNVFYTTLAAGTHRISLFWYGQNGLIGVGGTYPAILIAEVL